MGKLFEKVSLSEGLMVMLIGLCIVFMVLIILIVAIKIQGGILSKIGKNKEAETNRAPDMGVPPKAAPVVAATTVASAQSGGAQGEMVVKGVDDDGLLAIIMAIVSHSSGIPVSSLQFHSIVRLD